MRGNLSIAIVALLSAFVGGIVATYVHPRPAVPPPQSPARPPEVVEPKIPAPEAYVQPAVAVAEKVGPAVVGITTEEVLRDFFTGRRIVEPRSTGSGVIFDSSGYIATNYHVVEGADRLVVALADGRRLAGRIRGIDPATDLAVVQVDAKGLPAAEFADSDRVKVGETAIAIGNPLGMEFERSVTAGIVSGIRSTLYGQELGRERVFQLIQTDAAINPGNSGGALVNARGQVIGINTLKIGETRNVEGMGFAIPSNTVKRVVTDLVHYGEVRRARLGVSFVSREQVEAVTGQTIERGLVIGQVVAGGPAALAGLQSFDVIIEMDGQPVNDLVDAVRILEMKRPGDLVRLRYRRDGRESTVTVTLDQLRLPR